MGSDTLSLQGSGKRESSRKNFSWRQIDAAGCSKVHSVASNLPLWRHQQEYTVESELFLCTYCNLPLCAYIFRKIWPKEESLKSRSALPRGMYIVHRARNVRLYVLSDATRFYSSLFPTTKSLDPGKGCTSSSSQRLYKWEASKKKTSRMMQFCESW